MNCNRLRSQLGLHAGDDLPAREAAEVEAHLRSCLNCFREFGALRDLLAKVRSTARVLPAGVRGPGSLVDSVMAEIHGPPPALPRLLPRIALASGWAAALVLGVTLGWQSLAQRSAAPGRSGAGPEVPVVIDHGGDYLRGGAQVAPASSLDTLLDEQFHELDGAGPSRSPRVIAPRPIRVPKNY